MAKGSVNRVIILGRLGQDPDVRTTASGTQVVNLNVATNEVGRADEQGNRQDITEWHRIVIFGRIAELAAQYLSKGSRVYVEGRLQTRKWQDQNGQDRYTTEIVGNEMQLIGSRGDGQEQQIGECPQTPQRQQTPQQQGGGFGVQRLGGFNQAAPGNNYQQPVSQPRGHINQPPGGSHQTPDSGDSWEDD